MRSLIRSVVVVVSFVIAAGLAQPAGAQSYVPTDETKVHNMVNAKRAEKGLGKLARNSQLVLMARGQADRMEARGNIYHNPDLSGEITRRGLNWRRVGENVGMGPNVELIQQAFYDSPDHYENIVRRDYNTMGIGVVAGDDGKRYVVQVFANLVGGTAPATVVAKPAPAPATVRPAPAAQAPAAPAAIRPASATPAAKAPAPAPAPKPRPSADPNALTGGYVTPVELDGFDQGRYSAFGSSGLGRIVDALTFWS